MAIQEIVDLSAIADRPRGEPSATKTAMASLFADTFGQTDSASPSIGKKPKKAQARSRRKIWDLPAGRHCMLVGNCLSVAELRQLSRRLRIGAADMSDYTLHTLVVDRCASRCAVAEAVQRLLDQRHVHAIRRFAKAKDGEAVLELWRSALAEGDIAGALWAAWTHPDAGEYEGVVIYGELHMLSHQLVERERSERQRLSELELQNAHLRGEAAGLRQTLADVRQEGKRHVAELEERRAGHEMLTVRHEQYEIALERAKRIEIQNGALRERTETLSRRLAGLEQRNTELARRIADLSDQLACFHELERETAPIEVPQDFPADDVIGQLGGHLAGRRILCVGGRTGLIDRYRRIVEAGGGHFLHHDGGLEERGHRIDTIVANADAVVCQVGHVSHSAYWRIKSACKQRQLPCVFVKSGGVTSFARELGLLIDQKDDALPSVGRGMFLAAVGASTTTP